MGCHMWLQIGNWLAETYDTIDYVEALTRAGEACESFDSTADEFIYGEFDMSFFLGLMKVRPHGYTDGVHDVTW